LYNAEVGTSGQRVRLDVSSGKGEPFALDGKNDEPEKETATLRERLLRQQQWLPSGNRFLWERSLASAQVVKWKNGEGQEMEGILTLPPLQTGVKAPYKLVVHPHGGPHSRSVMGFDFTVQVLAAHGYAVFQPNFRGSAGYGQKFIDADRGDFGGGDMRDILAG